MMLCLLERIFESFILMNGLNHQYAFVLVTSFELHRLDSFRFIIFRIKMIFSQFQPTYAKYAHPSMKRLVMLAVTMTIIEFRILITHYI